MSVNEKTTAVYRTTADYRNEIEQREAGIVCGAHEHSNDSKRIDQYDGLRGKYMVIKADTGELVKNCFVLRPDRDPAAVTALRAYAEATDNGTLAADIINWVGADGNAALTQEDLNRMHFDKVWLSYGSDSDHGEDGEWAVVIYGQIYSIDTLDGSGFEELLKDSSLSGETLDNPSGQYKVYRRPSGTI